MSTILQPLWFFFRKMAGHPVALIFFLLNVSKAILFRHLMGRESCDAGCLLLFFISSTLFLGAAYALLFSTRSRVPLVTFYVLQLIYFVANTTYVHFFEYYLTVNQALEYVWQMFPVLKHGLLIFPAKYWIFLIDLPFFLLLISRRAFPFLNMEAIRFVRLKILVVFLFLSSLALSLHGLHVWMGLDRDIKNPEFHDACFVHDVGLPLFQVYDFFHDLIAEHDSEHLHYLKTSNRRMEFHAARQKSNIVLIQVEALDAAAVMACHHGIPVMPHLNALRNHSIYYPSTLSYHAGGGSSDGEFVILNSVEPLYYHSVYFEKNYFFPNTFVKVFCRNGYQTLAFHGNQGSCWKRDEAFRRMGYSRFWDLAATGLKEAGWGAPDEDVFRFAQSRLARTKPPFFAHIITMSSHYPYQNANNYFHDPSFDDITNDMVRNYFNSMRYTDNAINKLVEDLRRLPHTVIFIYGDHACHVQAHEFKASKFLIANRDLEFVPLFILTPDARVYHEKKYAACFLDLAPTILAASGVGGHYATFGQNLIQYPLENSNIPFHNMAFSREKLFEQCLKSFTFPATGEPLPGGVD